MPFIRYIYYYYYGIMPFIGYILYTTTEQLYYYEHRYTNIDKLYTTTIPNNFIITSIDISISINCILPPNNIIITSIDAAVLSPGCLPPSLSPLLGQGLLFLLAGNYQDISPLAYVLLTYYQRIVDRLSSQCPGVYPGHSYIIGWGPLPYLLINLYTYLY